MSLSAQFLLMFGLYLAIFVSFTILKTTTIPDVHELARDVLKACFGYLGKLCEHFKNYTFRILEHRYITFMYI